MWNWIISGLLVVSVSSGAANLENESFYRDKWCNANNGQAEYRLRDKTRVDCLFDNYAVEVDFAEKWYGGVGQALHYGALTGRTPGLLLILRTHHDKRYLQRALRVVEQYNLPLKIWTINSWE